MSLAKVKNLKAVTVSACRHSIVLQLELLAHWDRFGSTAYKFVCDVSHLHRAFDVDKCIDVFPHTN